MKHQAFEKLGGDGWTLSDAIFADCAKRGPEGYAAELMQSKATALRR